MSYLSTLTLKYLFTFVRLTESIILSSWHKMLLGSSVCSLERGFPTKWTRIMFDNFSESRRLKLIINSKHYAMHFEAFCTIWYFCVAMMTQWMLGRRGHLGAVQTSYIKHGYITPVQSVAGRCVQCSVPSMAQTEPDKAAPAEQSYTSHGCGEMWAQSQPQEEVSAWTLL